MGGKLAGTGLRSRAVDLRALVPRTIIRHAEPPRIAIHRGFARAEARVVAKSAVLKKELGVRDLVLTQILFIVGLTWIGVAGKLGPAHVLLWSLAIVLFYLPSAAVVIYLNRLMPLEGGLYQWAKLGFNGTVGFLLAWNLWLYVILNTSEIGLQCSTYVAYALGPGAAWMTKSAVVRRVLELPRLGRMVVISIIGLSVGKWVHNVGGVFMLIIFGAILLLPILEPGHGTSARVSILCARRPRIHTLQPQHPRQARDSGRSADSSTWRFSPARPGRRRGRSGGRYGSRPR